MRYRRHPGNRRRNRCRSAAGVAGLTTRQPGFVYLWEYRVAAEHRDSFVALYGAEGEWVRLFRRADGYLGTDLLQDLSDPQRFLTADSWMSRAARDRFRIDFAQNFAALDARGESLTTAERCIGDFELQL